MSMCHSPWTSGRIPKSRRNHRWPICRTTIFPKRLSSCGRGGHGCVRACVDTVRGIITGSIMDKIEIIVSKSVCVVAGRSSENYAYGGKKKSREICIHVIIKSPGRSRCRFVTPPPVNTAAAVVVVVVVV